MISLLNRQIQLEAERGISCFSRPVKTAKRHSWSEALPLGNTGLRDVLGRQDSTQGWRKMLTAQPSGRGEGSSDNGPPGSVFTVVVVSRVRTYVELKSVCSLNVCTLRCIHCASATLQKIVYRLGSPHRRGYLLDVRPRVRVVSCVGFTSLSG